MKDLQFEQLENEKFAELNIEEMKKIKGGQTYKRQRCATCKSNGRNKWNDRDQEIEWNDCA